MSAVFDLPPHAFAAALATLPGIGPAGLVDILGRHDPQTAWSRVLAGEVRRPERPTSTGTRPPEWAGVARRVDVAARWRRLRAKGIGVTYIGQPEFPDALETDPQPPGVLFWLGELAAVNGPCVAIVGTRRCTGYGRRAAFEFGRDLARCGVCVVSGLALGIDGAAHTGALAVAEPTVPPGVATPAGIAASGVDCPYPRRHVELWSRVAGTGAVMSETPPGQAAQAWRFPARNRVIAALSQAVLVVESAEGGGSMLTVEHALKRDIPVLAVPGPVNSAASAGTNKLLYDGAIPARNAGDVLAAIGDFRPWPPSPVTSAPTSNAATRENTLDERTQRVLAAIDWTPTPTVALAEQAGLPLGELSSVLLRLEDLGFIAGVSGDVGSWERRR